MKVITTELQASVAASSEDAAWPATNLFSDYVRQRWQAASGNTATLTVSISAGGANTLALCYTNATSVAWTLKNSGGSTVSSGTKTLTTPNTVDRFWLEFTAQSAACSVVLVFTAPVGAVVYAGLIRAGVRSEFPNPNQDGKKEGRVSHSIVKPLSNGARYIKKRHIVRSFSGSIRMVRETQLRQWLDIFDDNGEEPLMWLPVHGIDDNQFVVFGHQLQPPDTGHSWPNHSLVTYYIEEAV